MGTLADSLFTVLMGWVRALVNSIWALFSADHTTLLGVFRQKLDADRAGDYRGGACGGLACLACALAALSSVGSARAAPAPPSVSGGRRRGGARACGPDAPARTGCCVPGGKRKLAAA